MNNSGLGIFLIVQRELSVGGLLAFVMYVNLVIGPIFSFVQMDYKLSRIKPSFETYINFLELSEEENLYDVNKTIRLNDFNIENICFKNVCWKYEQQSILSNISFNINRNEKIALIGHNGCGKSSIIDLLLRFREPSRGTICINGININNMELNEYRKLFSVIEQDMFLFDKSIADNLLANVSVKYDDDAKTAMCKWLIGQIEKLPKGLETETGHNGNLLSGGEKQKVVLLRGLLKEKAKILILDEATSNYDVASEKIFNDFVLNTLKYQCMIVITHRPEVLKVVDRIVVIENGMIIDQGTYWTLLEKNILQKYII